MTLKEIKEILYKEKRKIEKVEKILEEQRELSDSINLLNVKPDLFFYCLSLLSTQQKAPLCEEYIIKQLKGEKIKSSLDRGDFKINGEYYELKCSFNNKGENLNIRQIRLYQDVNYYLCGYVDIFCLKKSYFYILTKIEMEKEVRMLGSFTHGTKAAQKEKGNSEYSITIPINPLNDTFLRWNEKYGIKNFLERWDIEK